MASGCSAPKRMFCYGCGLSGVIRSHCVNCSKKLQKGGNCEFRQFSSGNNRNRSYHTKTRQRKATKEQSKIQRKSRPISSIGFSRVKNKLGSSSQCPVMNSLNSVSNDSSDYVRTENLVESISRSSCEWKNWLKIVKNFVKYGIFSYQPNIDSIGFGVR
uniref:Uncharacterized protein LOC114338543 n=1 Tax=Diabrotica virgifera virgifera TaxID=50390 RepID=A0A6P7G7B0_DIAVI